MYTLLVCFEALLNSLSAFDAHKDAPDRRWRAISVPSRAVADFLWRTRLDKRKSVMI
jgi:hypothetical protein